MVRYSEQQSRPNDVKGGKKKKKPVKWASVYSDSRGAQSETFLSSLISLKL